MPIFDTLARPALVELKRARVLGRLQECRGQAGHGEPCIVDQHGAEEEELAAAREFVETARVLVLEPRP